jgi:hypothetical protein
MKYQIFTLTIGAVGFTKLYFSPTVLAGALALLGCTALIGFWDDVMLRLSILSTTKQSLNN